MKILVVDDEEACRRLLQDIFAAEPYVQITPAGDGAEAWWLLTEPGQEFDICVIDVKMPVVDGLALVERMRSVSSLRMMPVILCTGFSDRETVAKAVRLGITHYVVKPYDPAGLREKIRAAVA